MKYKYKYIHTRRTEWYDFFIDEKKKTNNILKLISSVYVLIISLFFIHSFLLFFVLK